MIELHLDQQEQEVLVNMLEECIQDTRGEIVHTERSEYRAMLKAREALLNKMLLEVQRAAQDPVAA